jgi:hypothetical protein
MIAVSSTTLAALFHHLPPATSTHRAVNQLPLAWRMTPKMPQTPARWKPKKPRHCIHIILSAPFPDVQPWPRRKFPPAPAKGKLISHHPFPAPFSAMFT